MNTTIKLCSKDRYLKKSRSLEYHFMNGKREYNSFTTLLYPISKYILKQSLTYIGHCASIGAKIQTKYLGIEKHRGQKYRRNISAWRLNFNAKLLFTTQHLAGLGTGTADGNLIKFENEQSWEIVSIWMDCVGD